MDKKHIHYLIATIVFIIVVLGIIFLMLEEEIITHSINKNLIIFFILFAYLVSALWVHFHHKSKYNNNGKDKETDEQVFGK